jgi:hypothetical protein
MLFVFVLAFPVLVSAAIQREIDGVKYYLHDDFDTADGECRLRGYNDASSFYSTSNTTTNVVFLDTKGNVIKKITKDTTYYPVIEGLNCN